MLGHHATWYFAQVNDVVDRMTLTVHFLQYLPVSHLIQAAITGRDAFPQPIRGFGKARLIFPQSTTETVLPIKTLPETSLPGGPPPSCLRQRLAKHAIKEGRQGGTLKHAASKGCQNRSASLEDVHRPCFRHDQLKKDLPLYWP